MSEWQPIETAPKPKKGENLIPVLLALHHPDGAYSGCMVMCWNAYNSDWDDGMGNSTGDWDDDSEKPTHWMPLPEPPTKFSSVLVLASEHKDYT